MSDDELAFLHTIAASPGDDLPRLVFADWLDEQGELEQRARAAFIRMQIAEYRSAEAWDDKPLDRRSQLILDDYRDAWLENVPERARNLVEFERGFPDRVEFSPDSGTVAALFGRTPPTLLTVDRLCVTYGGPRLGSAVDELAACAGLGRLRALTIKSGPRGQNTRLLCDSPHLTGLRELTLNNAGLRDDTIRGLADAAHLRTVERLTVSANPVTPVTLAWLGELPTFPNLAHFDCHWSPLDGGAGQPSFADLARSRLVAPVRRLGWHYGGFTPDLDALDALAEGGVAPALEHLTLGGHWRDSARASLGYFLGSLDRPRLRHLTIQASFPFGSSDHNLGQALANAPTLAGLEGLALLGFKVDAPTVIGLMESPHLQNLKHLDLDAPHSDRILTGYLDESDRAARLDSLYLGPKWPGLRTSKRLRDRLAPVLRRYHVGSATYERLHPWTPADDGP